MSVYYYHHRFIIPTESNAYWYKLTLYCQCAWFGSGVLYMKTDIQGAHPSYFKDHNIYLGKNEKVCGLELANRRFHTLMKYVAAC